MDVSPLPRQRRWTPTAQRADDEPALHSRETFNPTRIRRLPDHPQIARAGDWMTNVTHPRVYVLSGQRTPKRGEHVALRSVEEMWIAEVEDDGMLKVRDEHGFSVRVRANTLHWDEEAATWRSN